MIDPALLLALYLHRPVDLVSRVYAAGGVDAVAVVEMESHFNPLTERREPQGSSWGLFQLYDRYHAQHRGNLAAHIRAGVAFLEKCKQAWDSVAGRANDRGVSIPFTPASPALSFAAAVAHYNGGTHPGAYSLAWGKRVEKKRDELVRWLAWREIRAMETAR